MCSVPRATGHRLLPPRSSSKLASECVCESTEERAVVICGHCGPRRSELQLYFGGSLNNFNEVLACENALSYERVHEAFSQQQRCLAMRTSERGSARARGPEIVKPNGVQGGIPLSAGTFEVLTESAYSPARYQVSGSTYRSTK